MKKVILALAIVSTLSLVSCKNTNSTETQTTTVDSTAVQADSTNVQADSTAVDTTTTVK
jgi:hypothetical protein